MSNIEDTYMNGMEDFDIDEHNEYLLIAKSEPLNNDDEQEEEEDTIYHEDIMTKEETQNNFLISKHEMYYDENDSTEFNEMDLLNNSSSNYLEDNKMKIIKQETNDMDYINQESSSDNDEGINDDNNGNNDDDDDDASESDEKGDEETMATFYTSDGQRLALYALENSEDIFAVSVYDESTPPNNFQFLAKSDVERLISEGAIETVKKPSQLKKKSFHVGETPPIPKKITTPTTTNHSPTINRLQSSYQYANVNVNVNANQNISSPLRANPTKTIYQNMHKPRKQTILSSNVKIIKHYSKPPSRINPRDVVQKSTVQHILQDNYEEDELTLDDVAHLFSNETIQNKNGINKFNDNRNNIAGSPIKTPDKPHITRRIPQILSNTASKYSTNTINNNNNNNSSHSSTIVHRNSPEIRNNFLGKGVSPPPPPDDTNISGLNSPKSSTDELTNFSRMKRSRKQQLTFVDRADSEIIIQALAEQEEEKNKEEAKKRTKRGRKKRELPRKKKLAVSKGSKKHKSFGKKKYAARRIEIIDVDAEIVDESGSKKKKNKIDEITIYDGKGKCSSDKENDVIEVGDTDEDNRKEQDQDQEEEEGIVGEDEDEDNNEEIEKNNKNKSSTKKFECHDCHRTFYTKSQLIKHSKICQKSSLNTNKNNHDKTRLNSLRSSRSNKNDNNVSNDDEKKYTCKTCGDKFDVVVALARHVRCTHSLPKKKINNDPTNEDPEYSISPHTLRSHEKTNVFNKNTRTRRKIQMLEPQIVFKRKIYKKIIKTSWKSKSMDCYDCAKWFPSVSLLLAHSLQHATKKTAQFLHKIKIQKSIQHTNKKTSIKKRARPKKC